MNPNVARIQEVHQRYGALLQISFFQPGTFLFQSLFDIGQHRFGLLAAVEHVTEGQQHSSGLIERVGVGAVDTDHVGGGNAFQQTGSGGHFGAGHDQVRLQFGNGLQAGGDSRAHVGHAFLRQCGLPDPVVIALQVRHTHRRYPE